MKKISILITILICQLIHSQENNIPERFSQKAFGQIDFLSINMPETTIPNEANMGFTGIHYNLVINDWSYAGVGLYGSVIGARGGFFTLGVNAGIKKYLSNKLFFDTGFHFGGGGGAAAPDGGGAFILPHANLGYDFKIFSLTAGWSYINFFDDGLIKNHQLNMALQIPLSFEYAKNSEKEKSFNYEVLKTSKWNTEARRNSLLFHINNLKITGRSKNSKGNLYNGETIRLAGFEFSSFINNNWFYSLKVDGAFDGIDAGFMDVFLGGGYQYAFHKNRTRILAKFFIGAGGGGGVETEGGVLLQPDISVEQKLFDNFYVSLNKGYIFTPNSNFTTSSWGLGIKYDVYRNGIHFNNNKFTNSKFKGFEVSVGHDVYFNAKRKTNPTENLHQISLQINFELNKHIYVAGQTSFANFGDAGAYGEGIVGFGIKSDPIFNKKTTFFAQFLAGAAGGGNISTGQGLITKPSIGVAYKLHKNLSTKFSAGYVKAHNGKLNSTFLNIGINYRLSFLKMK